MKMRVRFTRTETGGGHTVWAPVQSLPGAVDPWFWTSLGRIRQAEDGSWVAIARVHFDSTELEIVEGLPDRAAAAIYLAREFERQSALPANKRVAA